MTNRAVTKSPAITTASVRTVRSTTTSIETLKSIAVLLFDMSDLKELRNDILREVYAEAEPSLDFDKMLDNPDDQPDDWYQRHYLSDERQEEIFEKHVENFERELTRSEHADLALTCITSLGPTANKELAEETRNE